MNLDIEITFAGAGRDADFGTAVFDSFMRVEPHWDPLVTQDADSDTLIVELTLESANLVDANARLAAVLRAVADDLDSSTPMTGVHIDVAGRELATA